MVIAIDDFSSCGKSTLAKALARKLSFAYVDSGAMYRAVTLYFLNHDVLLSNNEEVLSALESINIDFDTVEGRNICLLNGQDIEVEIRSMRVSNNVSEVAAIGSVRTKLVELQRNIGNTKSLIMDGRDIGTVVFPRADIKFFITADKEVRAQRRYSELIAAGKEVSIREVRSNLEHRDHIDTTRDISPLKQAEDAIVIDNTYMTREEQLDLALTYINNKTKRLC